jgi:hypothetical protein
MLSVAAGLHGSANGQRFMQSYQTSFIGGNANGRDARVRLNPVDKIC